MPDAPTPPERTKDDAGPAETSAADRAATPAPGMDWRLVTIVAVAVLFLIAAYVNRKYYGKRSRQQDADRPSASGPADTGADRQPAPPLTPAEQYASLTRLRQFQAAETIFREGDRTFILARPPLPMPSKKDPKKIGLIRPGRLLEITQRPDGVSPLMFHRRELPGKPPRMWFMDTFPPLGVDDRIKLVFKPSGDVALTEISDTDHVIGLSIGDEASAYPIKMANYHDVINDTVGGKRVVIVWSALADAACAMASTLPNGEGLSFGSAGLIFQGGIVLYEVQSMSLWSPLSRTCIAGKHAGTMLEPIRTTVTTWKVWKRLHPATRALVATRPMLDLKYDLNPALPSPDYLRSSMVFYPVYGLDIRKSPMNLKTRVFGVTGPDGKAVKAYTVAHLRDTTGAFQDTIGGEKVTIEYDQEGNLLSATDASGKRLFTEAMLWMCWAAVHPRTEVWQQDKLTPPFGTAAETERTQVPGRAVDDAR